MEKLEVINQRLLDNYGRGVSELPNYRVVWSSSEREIRTGVFTKMLGDIYLGSEMATREVDKYPMFPECWILEYVMPNLTNMELHSKTSYEPIWVFAPELDADWEAIEKIIYFHIHKEAPKTQKMLDHDEEQKKLAQEAEILDELKHEDPFPNKMYDSAVVTVPGVKHV